jgi:hypothetical protein
MTGTGRTLLIKRLIEVLFPAQVIDYGPSEICGWQRLRQCTWLYVTQPSNGTRIGLLQRILHAMDMAMGTDYYKQRANADVLLVEVCAKLALHRVALLVIDENHEENLEDSPWANQFALFYQSAMNLGVSVLLVGNPRAFDNLGSMSQLQSRLMVGGVHHFKPAPSAKTPWWNEDFFPRLKRRLCVVENFELGDSQLNNVMHEKSGGVPRYVNQLWCQSQRVALRRGGSTATLTMQDILDAEASPFYLPAKGVVDSMRNPSDPSKQSYSDLPEDVYSTHKVTASGSGTPALQRQLAKMDSVTSDAVKLFVTKFKRAQTREVNKALKELQQLTKLTPEEIRQLGISERLVQAAEDLQKREAKAPKAGSAKK